MVFKLALATAVLAATVSASHIKRVTCPDGNVTSNAACCVFFPLLDDLQTNLFDGQCGEDVHESLRLTFHDAIGFSKSGKFQGNGADGSMIIFSDIELAFPENAGINDSVDALSPFLKNHNVTAGDLIQFAGAVGITNCPGAPKLQFLAGRPNATIPASNQTVPLPQDDIETIFNRMEDGGFTPIELVHLLVSHTIARSDTLVPGQMAVPFDTTPFTFDTQFFLETLLKGVGVPFGVNNSAGAEVDSPLPESHEMRLQSDFIISRDNRTACEWQSMVNNQQLMMANFQSAMMKLAVVGQDISNLVDCSDVIPTPVPPVSKPATFPAGTNSSDLQLVCPSAFPTLGVDPGQPSIIPECPDGDINLADCPS